MKNGCVLTGGVGSGKSITSLAYYVTRVCGGSLDRSTPMTAPKNLLIITKAKKRDDLEWLGEALHVGLFAEPELSYGGVQVIVDSWQNCKKYEDLEDWFVIWDEQGASGAGKWSKTFVKMCKKNEWVMLSATPADTWIDYIPLFLAHNFYRNRTAFMEEHVRWSYRGKYPQIQGYYGTHELKRLRDSILVEMPMERHTVRHLVNEMVGYDKEMFDRVWKRRWNVYDDVPLIDVAEMHRVGRRVVNEDPDRGLRLEKLSANHPRLIIWYTFNYELDRLREVGEKIGIEVAEWNGHKHQKVPTGDRWWYLVQYQSGAEAWNCTTTDAMVFYSLTYSHKTFEQAQGRIDRLDTPFIDLWYYVLMSESRIDKLIWRALSTKRDFHVGRNEKFAA